MSKDIFDPDHQTKLMCKDCGFLTNSAAEFSDHVRQCKVRPVRQLTDEANRK